MPWSVLGQSWTRVTTGSRWELLLHSWPASPSGWTLRSDGILVSVQGQPWVSPSLAVRGPLPSSALWGLAGIQERRGLSEPKDAHHQALSLEAEIHNCEFLHELITRFLLVFKIRRSHFAPGSKMTLNSVISHEPLPLNLDNILAFPDSEQRVPPP